MKVETADEILNLDNVQLADVETNVLQGSAPDDNAAKSVPFACLCAGTTSWSWFEQILTRIQMGGIHCGRYWTSTKKTSE